MVSDTKPNSMAKGNWNKTKKKTKTKTNHSRKAYNLGDHYEQKLKSFLSDQVPLNLKVVKQDLPI